VCQEAIDPWVILAGLQESFFVVQMSLLGTMDESAPLEPCRAFQRFLTLLCCIKSTTSRVRNATVHHLLGQLLVMVRFKSIATAIVQRIVDHRRRSMHAVTRVIRPRRGRSPAVVAVAATAVATTAVPHFTATMVTVVVAVAILAHGRRWVL
jgi:hypothetical protein